MYKRFRGGDLTGPTSSTIHGMTHMCIFYIFHALLNGDFEANSTTTNTLYIRHTCERVHNPIYACLRVDYHLNDTRICTYLNSKQMIHMRV